MTTRSITRGILTFLVVIGVTLPAMGQRWKLRRYEVGGGLGVTQVFGDLGGTVSEKNWFGLKDIQIDETRLAFDSYARYRLDPVYSLKLNLFMGLVSANEKDLNSRNNRDISFKTKLLEFSLQGEYSFIAEERRYKSAAMFNRRGMINNYMSVGAYGFLGIGAVVSFPKVVFGPERLEQLIHETDDIRGTNVAPVIPFGIGLKYIISDRWLVNAELGYRIPFTDYIEGFKQMTFSKHNDLYYFVNINIGYRLETTRRGLPIFLDKEYRAVRSGRRSSPARKNKPRSKKEALE